MKKGDVYIVNHTLVGYYTSEEAKKQKATHKTGKVYKGKYYIYNSANGAINVTKVKGVAGSWINTDVAKQQKKKEANTKNKVKYGEKRLIDLKKIDTTSSRRVELKAIYIGKKIGIINGYQQKDLFYPEQFTFDDCACGQTDQITVTYSDENQDWMKNWFPAKGDFIRASISVRNWRKQGDNRTLRCGKFLLDDVSFRGPQNTITIAAISCPIHSGFSKTKCSKTWKKISIRQIAATIAKNSELQLNYSASDMVLDEVKQSQETDMNFLFHLTSNYGFAMKVYNDKLLIYDERKQEEKKAVAIIKKEDCESWSPKATLVGTYDGVTISYTKSKSKKTLTYRYVKTQGKNILKLTEKADSYKEAELKAKARLHAENKKAITMSLSLQGDINYIAGNCYTLTGFGKFNGKYYLDKVSHSISGNGYKVALDLHKIGNQDTTIKKAIKKSSEQSEKSWKKGTKYEVYGTLKGYYTSEEAKQQKATHKTGRIYKGMYYIFHTSNGMLNITKVKGVAGSWINPKQNKT